MFVKIQILGHSWGHALHRFRLLRRFLTQRMCSFGFVLILIVQLGRGAEPNYGSKFVLLTTKLPLGHFGRQVVKVWRPINAVFPLSRISVKSTAESVAKPIRGILGSFSNTSQQLPVVLNSFALRALRSSAAKVLKCSKNSCVSPRTTTSCLTLNIFSATSQRILAIRTGFLLFLTASYWLLLYS